MLQEGQLQKLRGTKVYLQVVNNTEKLIMDFINSFDPSNETLVTELTALKNKIQ